MSVRRTEGQDSADEAQAGPPGGADRRLYEGTWSAEALEKKFVVIRQDGDDLRGVLRVDGVMEVFDDPGAPEFGGEMQVRRFYGGPRRVHVVWERDEPPDGYDEAESFLGVVGRVQQQPPAPPDGFTDVRSFGGAVRRIRLPEEAD